MNQPNCCIISNLQQGVSPGGPSHPGPLSIALGGHPLATETRLEEEGGRCVTHCNTTMRLQRLLKLHFQFNPWDAKNTAAREVLRRSAAPSARKTNPECSVTYKMRTDKQPPVVLVQYDTGMSNQSCSFFPTRPSCKPGGKEERRRCVWVFLFCSAGVCVLVHSS